MGLYLRCRAKTKSFMVQRRVGGRLVQRVLGPVTLAAARRKAQVVWTQMKPKPEGGVPTLEEAWHVYVQERELAETTRKEYQHLLKYVPETWRRRTLDQAGQDRAGVRALYSTLLRRHGRALTSYVFRVLRACYNWYRKVMPDLPENPCVVVDLPQLPARDWALSDEQLTVWWKAVAKLAPVKRTWWLTALLTGARANSIAQLKWADLDFEQKVIQFRVTKRNRPYMVPMSDRLAEVLSKYKRWDAAPSDWVFPSPVHPDRPLRSKVREKAPSIPSPHHLRHTFRTRLVGLGATPDQARLLLGHSLGGDVSRGYITPARLVESLRPLANAMAEEYARVLGW